MFKLMMKRWKSKKQTVMLIITGYFIGILVLSIGIGFICDQMDYVYDRFAGDSSEQLRIELVSEEEDAAVGMAIDELSKYGECLVITDAMIDISKDGGAADFGELELVTMERFADIPIPVVSGQYFDVSNRFGAVVGRDLARRLGVSAGDSVSAGGITYNVIGIAGRSHRHTQFDEKIYLPYADYVKDNGDFGTDSVVVKILLREGKDKVLSEMHGLKKRLDIYDIKIRYANVNGVNGSALNNTILGVAATAGVILIISTLNVVNLILFWVFQRQKEFAIFRIIGATRWYIVKWVVLEVVLMALIGAVLAIPAQLSLVNLFSEEISKMEIYVSVSWVNVIAVVAASIICGVAAAVVPAFRVVRVKPGEAMKSY